LENLVNEAALLAARNDKEKVDMGDFELAKDKVMMGAERRSMIISDEEKRNTAYHEAGHALVAKLLPGADPIHKVTIIPRGMALGLTQQLPIDEKHTYGKEYLLNNLVILFGGRVAEELILDHTTTGAGNDIEKATDLAHRMVCEWGMSEKLGPMTFGKKEEEIFLGRDFTQRVDYSETTAVQIDGEVRRVLMESYERAKLIYARSKWQSIIEIHDRRSAKDSIHRFKSAPAPRVLLSPSVGTGWDFPMDQARFQIVAKLPFIDSRQEVVKARIRTDKSYSDYVAMVSLIQMAGRGVRSSSDYCRTYLIDDNWSAWFYPRNKKLVPRWFRDSVRRVKSLDKALKR
jgi:hypothetical protein